MSKAFLLSEKNSEKEVYVVFRDDHMIDISICVGNADLTVNVTLNETETKRLFDRIRNDILYGDV